MDMSTPSARPPGSLWKWLITSRACVCVSNRRSSGGRRGSQDGAADL
jgi:hypothetical protein